MVIGVKSEPGADLIAPAPLHIVCCRYAPDGLGNAATDQFKRRRPRLRFRQGLPRSRRHPLRLRQLDDDGSRCPDFARNRARHRESVARGVRIKERSRSFPLGQRHRSGADRRWPLARHFVQRTRSRPRRRSPMEGHDSDESGRSRVARLHPPSPP